MLINDCFVTFFKRLDLFLLAVYFISLPIFQENTNAWTLVFKEAYYRRPGKFGVAILKKNFNYTYDKR